MSVTRTQIVEAAAPHLLSEIRIANGYHTDLAKAHLGRWVTPPKTDLPAVWVFWTGVEDKKLDSTIGRKVGSFTFAVRCVAKGHKSAGEKARDELAADVERAVETKKNGSFLDLPGVTFVQVFVEAVDPWEGGAEGMPTTLHVSDAVVRVVYKHPRAAP